MGFVAVSVVLAEKNNAVLFQLKRRNYRTEGPEVTPDDSVDLAYPWNCLYVPLQSWALFPWQYYGSLQPEFCRVIIWHPYCTAVCSNFIQSFWVWFKKKKGMFQMEAMLTEHGAASLPCARGCNTIPNIICTL